MTTRISYIGAALFAAATVLAGALYPGYSHLHEAVSQLAATNSPSAPIMIIGFFALGVGVVAAGVDMLRTLRGAAGRTAGALTVISGALLFVVGLARPACSDFIGACRAAEDAGTIPLHHVLHNLISALLFLLLTIAVFLQARAVAGNGAKRLGPPALLVGVVSSVTLVTLVVASLGPVAGLVERAYLLVLFGWLIAVVPLTRRYTGSGMRGGGRALQRPVEVS
jgi:hypothetical membrane protein